MGTVNIWPVNARDRAVKVDEELHRAISKIVAGFSDNYHYTPDTTWEIARRVLEAQQTLQERKDRHARGDFSPELNNLEGHVCDLNDRLDGEPYSVAGKMLEKVNDCQGGGFTLSDASKLQELYNDLTEEVRKTDEMVITVGGLVKELSEAVK